MKYIRMSIVCSLVVILLTGCAALSNDTANKIVRPENKAVPLQGRWIVKNCHEESGSKSMVDSGLIGKAFVFDGNSLAFDGVNWENVNYKIKRVDAGEYFLRKTLTASSALDLSSSEIYVITASSEDKFLYEFIKLDDNQIVASIDNRLYCLTKAEDGTEGINGGLVLADSEKDEGETETEYKKESLNTGLLLGLRIPEPAENSGADEGIEEYSYRTLWISMKDNQPAPVLSASDIYLPRKDGFWMLKVNRESGKQAVKDSIAAAPVTGNKASKVSPLKPEEKLIEKMEKSSQRAILYVGNDFICTENTEEVIVKGSSSSAWKKVLRTIPVDNIDNTEGIKLTDLAGEDASLALEVAISRLLASSNNSSMKKVVSENQELNFALYRKTGHWFFKGRLNLESGGPMDYVDFNINLIPPSDMVAYDILHLPWTEIKDKVPETADAYTSPNKDLAVILTRESVLLYSIEGDRLADEPLKKLDLPEGGVVVMAEWATGKYVEYWDNSFKKNNKTEVLD